MRGLIAALRSPAARWIGLAASGAALGAFLLVLADTISGDDVRRLLLDHWAALLAALILYCLAYVPMTRAWILLARACGARISGADLTRIFLVSQIAKYLPGNVAQFVGRAWAGQMRGVPLKVTGTAVALEVAGVLAACAILAGGALALGLVVPAGQGARQFLVPLVVATAAVGALLGSVVLFRQDPERSAVFPAFLAACGGYLVLLGLLAAANIILVSEISGNWDWGLAGAVAGAFAVSWLVGFVTPGSPAGLGLRELTFFSLLAGSTSEASLLLAAAAFRLATVSGDLLAWLAGLLLKASPASRPLAT